MSENDPIAVAKESLENLRQQFTELQGKATLSEITSEIKEVDKTNGNIAKLLQSLGAAGYHFTNAAQERATQAQSAWQAIAESVPTQVSNAIVSIQPLLQQLNTQLSQASAAVSSPPIFNTLAKNVDASAQAVQAKIEEAVSHVRAGYEGAKESLETLESHLESVAWSLEQFKESGIELAGGEGVFIASKAEWAQTGKGSDDPDGFLYVTNQRIIFEQSEKKGKFLGLFGGKKVQNELWSVALSQITSLATERKGIIGGKAMLTLSTTHTDYPTLPIEIKGGFGNEHMKAIIEQAKLGNFSVPLGE